MSAAHTLRHLLMDPGMLVAPGAYDAIGARLIEQAGFKAAYMTGAGTSLARGYPDLGLLTMREMVDNAEAMVRSSAIPLIADADTGFGNELNVTRCVREYETRGVAATRPSLMRRQTTRTSTHQLTASRTNMSRQRTTVTGLSSLASANRLHTRHKARPRNRGAYAASCSNGSMSVRGPCRACPSAPARPGSPREAGVPKMLLLGCSPPGRTSSVHRPGRRRTATGASGAEGCRET